MTALRRYFQNFARWVRRGHAPPLRPDPLPASSWADHKRAYDRAQKAHRGQRAAYEDLRASTRAKLIADIFAEARALRVIDTHHRLISDPLVFEAAVKAIARQRVQGAQR